MESGANAVIDMHQHLLWGMDDGARNPSETMRMLRRAAEEGVRHVIATPHALPGKEEFPLELLDSRVGALNSWCRENGLDMAVHIGCELFYTGDACRLLREGRLPALGDSNCVLVEFPPSQSYTAIADAARRLHNAGFQPILAHVERYACLRRLALLAELHDREHVLMQMNAGAVLDGLGFMGERWKERAIRGGWIDMVGSDAHDCSVRPCRMRACFAALSEKYGRRRAMELCHDRAQEAIF